MVTNDDVRRIALALPDTVEGDDGHSYAVRVKGKDKGIAWPWRERIDPKKARVPNLDVLAVRVADLMEKDELIAAEPAIFFTEPHYNGYPAVLVRLAAIDADELRELLTDAWRCQASKKLVAEFDAGLRSS